MMHRFLFLIIGSIAVLLAGCSSIERLDSSNVSALGQISESQSDTAVSMKIAFELYDQTRGEAVLSDSISLSATFGAVSSLYGQDKAATFSSERLAMQLSDKVYLKLLAYFNNLENAGTASAE